MERSTALQVFESLEECRETQHEGDPPTYTVRLDASIDRESDTRYYRVRVQPTIWPNDTGDALLFVLEQAREHGTSVSIDNGAIELT